MDDPNKISLTQTLGGVLRPDTKNNRLASLYLHKNRYLNAIMLLMALTKFETQLDHLHSNFSLPSFPRNNGERGCSESSESSSLLSGCLQDDGKFGVERLQTFAPLDIRKAVDELSTVSEVSEESSRNMVRIRR